MGAVLTVSYADVAPVCNEDGLLLAFPGACAVKVTSGADGKQYRAALARIADAINEHLDATAPKPEPIKVGDRVAVRDYGHDGKVRAIDEQFNTALVTFDNRLWDWCALERLTKVPA